MEEVADYRGEVDETSNNRMLRYKNRRGIFASSPYRENFLSRAEPGEGNRSLKVISRSKRAASERVKETRLACLI